MSTLMSKILKTSTIKEAAQLSKSEFFGTSTETQTDVPILNLAFSGKLQGGFGSGITIFAGPSKCFKSSMGLIAVRSYLNKYPDAVCLFYDNEFGSIPPYFKSIGVDTERVVHAPIMHVEQLKFDIVKQLEAINKGERVIIFIDSLGNLASKKELEDTLAEKSVADMSRAKQIKSLFRMITPYLATKDLPCVVISHTYETMDLYPQQILSGGTGQYYAANTIFLIGRQQNKNAENELSGYNFILNVEKSRFVREKSKIPLTVDFEKGIQRWSGLLELAVDTGHVLVPTQGFYSSICAKDKKLRRKDTDTAEFWLPIFKDTDFMEIVTHHFRLDENEMFSQQEGDVELKKFLSENV